jgi:2-hydroxy-6-oxonona-2,4-dienedioate hydrolase
MYERVPARSVWANLSMLDLRLSYVRIGRWRTRVLEAGNRPDSLMLLSGTGGHLEAYARNIAALSARYHVVAYDYPGHGFTTLADNDIELPDYVEHLAELQDALKIERAHLCGESLGGWLSVKFAAAYPERVKRLVLNTPGGSMSDPQVMSRIRSLSQAAADDPTEEHIRARLAWLMADERSVTDELVDIRKAIYSQPGFADSMKHVLCLQEVDVRRRNMITNEDLKSIAAPVLVIWTSADPSGPPSAGMELAGTLPRGRFHLMHDAGHWPQWEQPEQFNQVVLDFLAEL